MKRDNVCMYDAFSWNWSKNVVCDDGGESMIKYTFCDPC